MFEIFLNWSGFGRNPTRATAARSGALDLLRGVAILLVLGCHFVMAPSSAGMLEPLAELWYRIGWAGVDLFFVLSGFLVSGLLFAEYQRTQRVDIARFLVRRGFKIWPAYLAYLGVVTVWLLGQQLRGQPGAPGWQAIWPNFLHVQNYFGTPRVHTWSLAVEEHFYLVGAGLAAILLGRGRFHYVRKFFPAVALASLVAVAWLRHTGFVSGGRESLNLLATHLRFDGLLTGSLAAYFVHFDPVRLKGITRHPLACVLAGLALAAPTLLLTPDHSALIAGAGLTLMYVGFALIMLGVLGLERAGGRWRTIFATAPARGMARVGFFSYGIYLWHLDLAHVPMKKIGHLIAPAELPAAIHWLLVTATYVALAAFVGALVSRLIEIPFLAIRDRYFPSKTMVESSGAPATAGKEPLAPGPAVASPAFLAGG